MRAPVADTPNNWVPTSKPSDGYAAAIGKELFDVQIRVSLVNGKIVSATIDNPVEVLERDCADEALPACGDPMAIRLDGTSKSEGLHCTQDDCSSCAPMLSQAGSLKDGSIYMLGVLLGLVAGSLDVKFGDLLLTALFVLASTMLLGVLRPRRPWRWTALVAVFVPVVQLSAYLLLTEKPSRTQIYESWLGFLTGIAGAYGGAMVRRRSGELFGRN
jgi:hypothetical protein